MCCKQGQFTAFEAYRSEAQARSEAIKLYNLHNETGPRAQVHLAPLSPLSGSPLLPEAPRQRLAPSPALPRSKDPHSLSREASAEELHNPMLMPPHFSARDPRIWAPAAPGSSGPLAGSLVPPGHRVHQDASAQQQQQQQQQQDASAQQQQQPREEGVGGLHPSAGVAERGTPALPGPKTRFSSDGRYQLPPRLRKADGRCWFRGYHARKVPGAPSRFTYEINIQHRVPPPNSRGTVHEYVLHSLHFAGRLVKQ